jgi:hypothetical protein
MGRIFPRGGRRKGMIFRRNVFIALMVALFVIPVMAFDQYSFNDRCNKEKKFCFNYTRVANDGIGDLLFFPIYYSDSWFTTRLMVTNVSDRFGVIAHVVVKEFLCGEPLCGFTIYLTPKDTWVGDLIASSSGSLSVKSTDDSVVVNGKTGSVNNVVTISCSSPSNPESTALFGYVEVSTLAYVDTDFHGTVDNETVDYHELMRQEGFTEEHAFMDWLYQEGKDSYRDVAYDNITSGEFNGLIFPSDEHFDFSQNNPMVVSGEINSKLEDGVLAGRMEIYGGQHLWGSYRALAIKDFSMLGDEVLNGTEYDYVHDYKTRYKLSVKDASFLDNVGYTEFLDSALVKKKIFVNYDNSDNATAHLLLLLFPTKQMEYDRYTQKCVAGNHTSDVWQESMFLERHIVNLETFGMSGQSKLCAYSPCVWYDSAVLVVYPDDFDPFYYPKGHLEVYLGNSDAGDFEVATPDGLESAVWKEVGGLPVIPMYIEVMPGGVEFEYPPFSSIY